MANEKQLIDEFKKELMSEFIRLCNGNDFNKLTLLKIGDVIDRLHEKYSAIPTADVAPETHGEWVPMNNPYWKNICAIAERQRAKGISIYGQGIEANPAEVITRIEYLQEELVDALMYCEWIKDGIRGTENWIPVTERLPENFVSVLGCMADAGPFPSVRECYTIGKEFYFPALLAVHPVTHWMPLPEPPHEDTK